MNVSYDAVRLLGLVKENKTRHILNFDGRLYKKQGSSMGHCSKGAVVMNVFVISFKHTRFFWCASGIIPTWLMIGLAHPAMAEMSNSCHGGSTTVCGVAFALPATTPAGATATVPIPSHVLGNSFAANGGSLQNSDLSFTVQCVADVDGNVSYRNIDADKINCNLFPCPTSAVTLCGASIPVGGTPLGGSVQVTMPAPFAQNSFTVQCVGNGDKPPVYQITEHAAVACDHP